MGGILYSLREGSPGYTHYNRRGDVVAKTDGAGSLTYQASYEAFGTRTQEVGATDDRQKANTKDEDPTSLLNEGFRYRDLETGTFITRDPLGFVDGPNMYAYVVQNPWTKFDPEGLNEVDITKEKLKVGDIGLQTEDGKTRVLDKASQVAMSEKVGVRPSEVNGEKVPSRIGHGIMISKDPESKGSDNMKSRVVRDGVS